MISSRCKHACAHTHTSAVFEEVCKLQHFVFFYRMSITVKVIANCTILENIYSSSREFREAISTAMSQASEIVGAQLEEDRIVYSDSNATLPSSQQLLGNQDITVMTHPAPTLSSMLSQMQQMQQSLAISHAPRLRNTTAQILLLAAGQTAFRGVPTDCDYFRRLGASHLGVCKISDVLGVPPARFMAQAEAVIVRRNGLIHPMTLGALDEEVEELQNAIATSPALLQLCKWECCIIMQYVEVKAAFPERFGGQLV